MLNVQIFQWVRQSGLSGVLIITLVAGLPVLNHWLRRAEPISVMRALLNRILPPEVHAFSGVSAVDHTPARSDNLLTCTFPDCLTRDWQMQQWFSPRIIVFADAILNHGGHGCGKVPQGWVRGNER